ncbi:MAG: response regulator [Proteobacteria bacterium]|nr:response regulator [Pseudomonadota bacterium]
MSIVGLLDIVSTIGFGLAVVFACRLSWRRVGQAPVALLVSCMALYALVGLSNTLEHLRITPYFDRYEDFIEVLFIPLFVFFVYSLRVATETRERLRAERELRRSQRQWAEIFQAIGHLTFILDLKHVVVHANRAAVESIGEPLDEIVGRRCFELLHGSDRPPENCPMEKLLADGATETVAMEMEALGDVHLVACTPVYDDAGRLAGVIHISTDITERRALEAQLLQAQKMEAVGRLAGGVAHDFNNLLAVILGYSQLALEKIEAHDPWRQDLEEITRAGERAAALTRQLLTFSRRQVLEPKALDLNAVVKGTEKMLRRLIGEDVELVTVCEPDLGTATVDPGQLEQVIMNLAVNARDAMPRGGRLSIETANVFLDEPYARRHSEVTSGPYVMLAVSDTGVGMDEEVRSRIFEPFFTTKEKDQGTGLGLATVYGIIRQSGGHIYVYSEPDRGTTFKIYLPRTGAPEAAGDAVGEVVRDGRGSETVLVVEDDDLVRKMARRSMENYGYRVLEASNGGEAVLICEQNPGDIDLVLSDVVLPRMSGPQLIGRLRAMRPGLRVLYMYGYTDNAIVHHGVLDQGVNFISKPFSPQALAQKVRKILDDPA